MHVFVHLESVMCVPSLVNFDLYQPKRRKGTCLSVLCESYIYVLLKAVPCGILCSQLHQCPLCVCVCVFVSGMCAQLCYWLNLQTGKQHLRPSAWAEMPGHQAGLQQPGRWESWAGAARGNNYS